MEEENRQIDISGILCYEIPKDGGESSSRIHDNNRALGFYIKLYFTRKANFFAGGFLTSPNQEMTYRSVISIYTEKILLTVAALNYLNAKSFGVVNTYLN